MRRLATLLFEAIVRDDHDEPDALEAMSQAFASGILQIPQGVEIVPSYEQFLNGPRTLTMIDIRFPHTAFGDGIGDIRIGWDPASEDPL